MPTAYLVDDVHQAQITNGVQELEIERGENKKIGISDHKEGSCYRMPCSTYKQI